MELSIIIVNWNTRELLRACLSSIFETTAKLEFEVIVVDNGSTDNSVQMVKDNFPQVKLIVNQDNTGYVYANNQGIETSKGEFVLLLNSDTVVLPGTLETMVDYMKNNPQTGVAGCHILNPDKTDQFSVRKLPRLSDQIIILTKMHNFFPWLLKKHLQFDFDFNKEQEVEQVMGAFMIIRREVIEQVGILDKNIWSWFEDVDYCKRIKATGWKIMYTPIAQIIHHKSKSFDQHLAVAKQKMLIKSMLYYFKKNHGTLSYLILWPFTKLSIFLAWLVQVFRIKKRNKQL